MFRPLLRPPYREWCIIGVLSAALAAGFFLPHTTEIVFVFAALGSLPILSRAAAALYRRKITIDTFNFVALAMSFAANEIRSAGFIVLMLSFAALLDWQTESRASNAVEELLKLKPSTARREEKGMVSEISVEEILTGDTVVVENGARVPVDGIVIFGEAYINEASVTGESRPVRKLVGDRVFGATLNESGALKIKATNVGKDSTIERMAELIREAGSHKSHSERLADRFASIFLPIVFMIGVGTYLVTRSIDMTAAIFLVACADDMSVAIPLAITAALGRAAKRGVIIKGGEWLDVLARAKTLVLDKTGTLTYGTFALKSIHLEVGVSAPEFWRLIGIAEKYSEHPVGRAIFREAATRVTDIPDPEQFAVYKGAGVFASYRKDAVVVGNEKIFQERGIRLPPKVLDELAKRRTESGETTSLMLRNGRLAGFVSVADVPRAEARASLQELQKIGVRRIVMLTGDNEETARAVSAALGIKEYRAAMTPEGKLRELEALSKKGGPVAMLGDGVNDAPALARADVGIAMGTAGTATAVEAADVVILTDNLSRLSEVVLLSRQTVSVIHTDMAIWLLTNVAGFALVFTGIAGPALAAFYNFATDFLPLLNSARLFRAKSEEKKR